MVKSDENVLDSCFPHIDARHMDPDPLYFIGARKILKLSVFNTGDQAVIRVAWYAIYLKPQQPAWKSFHPHLLHLAIILI